MGKPTKNHPLPMEDVKDLLLRGLKFADVSAATGYTSAELSNFCKAWNIVPRQGRRPRLVTNGTN
jgi:hypothetical protein